LRTRIGKSRWRGKEAFMKARMMVGVCLFAFMLLLSTTLQAQISQRMFDADIPFPFVAAGMHLPAGYYHVSHPGDPNLVIIQKDDNRARAVVYVKVSESDKKAATTKLVFNRYGDQYFLSEIWTESDRELHESCKCKAEQALIAKFGTPEVKVVLARD
jgi:hypothetical protein